MVAPHTAGDPMGERKWLNCRLVDIETQLEAQGHKISQPVISRLLKKHDYCLRVNRKQRESQPHPDRNCQFESILEQRRQHQAQGQPRLSVDTKKKEWVGNLR